MEIIYTFGFKLAILIQRNEAAGLGVLCLAIKDAGKSTQQISYQEFKSVLQEQLPRRLEKLQVPNRDQVVQEMLKFLSEKQSLFTLTAH